MTHLTISGEIAKINNIFITPKSKPIQEIALKREKGVYIYPQFHNDKVSLLKPFKIGDNVEITCVLYGKEIGHSHKIVVHSIIKKAG